MNISTKDRFLDISQNLARIGNWIADSGDTKKVLIERFIKQTRSYIEEVPQESLNSEAKSTFNKFAKEFNSLSREKIKSNNREEFAEKYLTWANILQHRSALT